MRKIKTKSNLKESAEILFFFLSLPPRRTGILESISAPPPVRRDTIFFALSLRPCYSRLPCGARQRALHKADQPHISSPGRERHNSGGENEEEDHFAQLQKMQRLALSLRESVTRSCTLGKIGCWLRLGTKAFMNAPKCMCTTRETMHWPSFVQGHFSMLCVILILQERTWVVLFSPTPCPLLDEEIYQICAINERYTNNKTGDLVE